MLKDGIVLASIVVDLGRNSNLPLSWSPLPARPAPTANAKMTTGTTTHQRSSRSCQARKTIPVAVMAMAIAPKGMMNDTTRSIWLSAMTANAETIPNVADDKARNIQSLILSIGNTLQTWAATPPVASTASTTDPVFNRPS